MIDAKTVLLSMDCSLSHFPSFPSKTGMGLGNRCAGAGVRIGHRIGCSYDCVRAKDRVVGDSGSTRNDLGATNMVLVRIMWKATDTIRLVETLRGSYRAIDVQRRAQNR